MEQEEIILTAKSRLFTLGEKGFHLPQVNLSMRVAFIHFIKYPFISNSRNFRWIILFLDYDFG